MMNFSLEKGHYDWNSQTNCLEFISDRDSTGDDRKRKSRSGFQLPSFSIPFFGNDRNTPMKSVRVLSSAGNAGFKTGGFVAGQRTSPRLGLFRHENATVTLEDVKSVALVELKRDKHESHSTVSSSFRCLYESNQFDNFLITLLRYFECFLEGIDQQKRPHKTNFLQPSKAELKAIEETKRKMDITKRHLGQTYCMLLLGIGMEEQHHMGCGKQRTSSTCRDQRMFEDMYLFCTNLIFITFRRREYNRIFAEVGDMLRSPTYNPSQRQSRHLSEDDGLAAPKPYIKDPRKPIGERIEELLSVQLPRVEKITPSAYRRQYGKRPAITKAIHQRSTALVSLLPLPVETSEYLFKTAGLRKLMQGSAETDDSIESSPPDLYGQQKIGIIGELMDLFDPDTLTPKNIDNEEDTESRDTDSPVSQSNNDLADPKVSQSEQRAISRATTEASMPI